MIFRFFYPELYNNSDVRKVEYNMTLIETLKEEDKNLTFIQVSYGYLPLVHCKFQLSNRLCVPIPNHIMVFSLLRYFGLEIDIKTG